ncbi:hypothetical protein RRG08_017179 [Elysia crispata]|uniref:Uncharacterized protein n=1 Tax=Elysia crispata TaxID=231223 RepID=A0AAE1B1T2_9GAST|nr:hypothetical protein RRG08_017179 [Elysia crispata]
MNHELSTIPGPIITVSDQTHDSASSVTSLRAAGRPAGEQPLPSIYLYGTVSNPLVRAVIPGHSRCLRNCDKTVIEPTVVKSIWFMPETFLTAPLAIRWPHRSVSRSELSITPVPHDGQGSMVDLQSKEDINKFVLEVAVKEPETLI